MTGFEIICIRNRINNLKEQLLLAPRNYVKEHIEEELQELTNKLELFENFNGIENNLNIIKVDFKNKRRIA